MLTQRIALLMRGIRETRQLLNMYVFSNFWLAVTVGDYKYTDIYIYIHTYRHIYIYIKTFIYIHISTYIYIYTYRYIYIYVFLLGTWVPQELSRGDGRGSSWRCLGRAPGGAAGRPEEGGGPAHLVHFAQALPVLAV